MLTIHQMLHFRGNLKGYVALNKNLAFLKFNLYQVKLFFSMLETFSGGRLPRPRELERSMHHQSVQHQERDQESDVQEREGQQGPADGHRPCRHPSTFTRGYQRQDCKVQKGHRGGSGVKNVI